jgi:hypothetical protein
LKVIASVPPLFVNVPTVVATIWTLPPLSVSVPLRPEHILRTGTAVARERERRAA